MDDNKQNNVRMENGGGRDGSLWNIRLMIKSLKQVDGFFGNDYGTAGAAGISKTWNREQTSSVGKKASPIMRYFGAQPGVEPFYEKNGQTSYICKQVCFLIK